MRLLGLKVELKLTYIIRIEYSQIADGRYTLGRI